MSGPRWLGRTLVLTIHADQLAQHGGHGGIRDPGAVESALGRAPARLNYDQDTDLLELAACYGFAIATSHPFTDGNKRTAFMCMFTFLGLNGLRIVAPEIEVVALMMGVASGDTDELALTEWLRHNTAAR